MMTFNESDSSSNHEGALYLLGREVEVWAYGINCETIEELIDKLEWCDSVGLNQETVRLQPRSFSMLLLG